MLLFCSDINNNMLFLFCSGINNMAFVLLQCQQHGCIIECSEKYKSFKLKIPQPDSERRHSPDFRTVFRIMIGPFSSCEIGKT